MVVLAVCSPPSPTTPLSTHCPPICTTLSSHAILTTFPIRVTLATLTNLPTLPTLATFITLTTRSILTTLHTLTTSTSPSSPPSTLRSHHPHRKYNTPVRSCYVDTVVMVVVVVVVVIVVVVVLSGWKWMVSWVAGGGVFGCW
jgi:hypothetical protein